MLKARLFLRRCKPSYGHRFFSTSGLNMNRSTSPSLLGRFLFTSGLVVGTAYTMDYYRPEINTIGDAVLMPILRFFHPENSHKLAVWACSKGLSPKDTQVDPAILETKVWNLTFPNPIGMAAGFDKNAEAMEGILDMGYGFVEIGSVTPQPQPGNPKPRVFRLMQDQAVINRYGFNSDGLAQVQSRLAAYMQHRNHNQASSRHRQGPCGVNLGKNKLTVDAASDYIQGIETLGPVADYLVVNISSPNTPGLRHLQAQAQLKELVQAVVRARDKVPGGQPQLPLLIKISPDLSLQDKQDIASVILDSDIDGLIISNTTITRPESMVGSDKKETGGLSGAPLAHLARQTLFDMYALTEGKVPIIGVGGIRTGQDAYDRIRAGASVVQMYSALVFDGPGAVGRAKQELAACLERDGFQSVQEAVGADHRMAE